MYKIIGGNHLEYGPVSAEQIRQWITEGRVNAETLVQAAGETNWRPISTFPEFAANFPGAEPPQPPPLTGAPPAFSASPANATGRSNALDEVSGPAIGLMIAGVLGILYAGMSLIGNLTGATLHTIEQFNYESGRNPHMFHAVQLWSGLWGTLMCLIHAGLAGFTLYGALNMKKLENHSLCLGASIVALIPCFCPCCFISIPIGIWALLVLNKPEVRNHFT